MIQTLEKSLEGAKKSGNESMVEILTKKIEAGVEVPAVAAKAVTDLDIAKAYIDTIYTARPVANFFGGDIMEPVFDWLYLLQIGMLICMVINLPKECILV